MYSLMVIYDHVYLQLNNTFDDIIGAQSHTIEWKYKEKL